MTESKLIGYVSVLVFHPNGSFTDYVNPCVELSAIPEQHDVMNFQGMRLSVWAAGKHHPDSQRFTVILRVNPAHISPATAARKLRGCGFKCFSRARKPRS